MLNRVQLKQQRRRKWTIWSLLVISLMVFLAPLSSYWLSDTAVRTNRCDATR